MGAALCRRVLCGRSGESGRCSFRCSEPRAGPRGHARAAAVAETAPRRAGRGDGLRRTAVRWLRCGGCAGIRGPRITASSADEAGRRERGGWRCVRETVRCVGTRCASGRLCGDPPVRGEVFAVGPTGYAPPGGCALRGRGDRTAGPVRSGRTGPSSSTSSRPGACRPRAGCSDQASGADSSTAPTWCINAVRSQLSWFVATRPSRKVPIVMPRISISCPVPTSGPTAPSM